METQAANSNQEAQTSRAPGKRLHDIKQIPRTLLQEAQARWGASVELSAARENGRYNGQVFADAEFVVQKVGTQSAVVHRRDQVDFYTTENMQKRHDANKLNDASLTIRYEGAQGRAYFYDPQRAAIDEMVHRIKKGAAEQFKGKALETFNKQLDAVKDAMIEKYRDAKNRGFEQRTTQHAATRDAATSRDR